MQWHAAPRAIGSVSRPTDSGCRGEHRHDRCLLGNRGGPGGWAVDDTRLFIAEHLHRRAIMEDLDSGARTSIDLPESAPNACLVSDDTAPMLTTLSRAAGNTPKSSLSTSPVSKRRPPQSRRCRRRVAVHTGSHQLTRSIAGTSSCDFVASPIRRHVTTPSAYAVTTERPAASES